MENQALPWLGLRDAKPKRGKESGVGGDCAPSDLVFVKCRGRKIEGTERATPKSSFLFFFSYIMRSLFLGTRSFVQR